ncbi:hypothetical protein HII36_09845 [Nonomuraea sp. NN258]|uniref:hypothetical protein n=1 Tax=Nonomuraea antri TaxID=2730852 RepID=UPI001569EBC3|nr:hypothetical protein [Nonomuraea antri]NRQ32138.1 hypothetical protein [Nonomuraea antri]
MSTIVLASGSFLGAWARERVTPLVTACGHQRHPLTYVAFAAGPPGQAGPGGDQLDAGHWPVINEP